MTVLYPLCVTCVEESLSLAVQCFKGLRIQCVNCITKKSNQSVLIAWREGANKLFFEVIPWGKFSNLPQVIQSIFFISAIIGMAFSFILEGIDEKRRCPRYNVAVLLILVISEKFTYFPVKSVRPQLCIVFLAVLSIACDGSYMEEFVVKSSNSKLALLSVVILSKILAIVAFLKNGKGKYICIYICLYIHICIYVYIYIYMALLSVVIL
jgi:hypothetical protein